MRWVSSEIVSLKLGILFTLKQQHEKIPFIWERFFCSQERCENFFSFSRSLFSRSFSLCKQSKGNVTLINEYFIAYTGLFRNFAPKGRARSFRVSKRFPWQYECVTGSKTGGKMQEIGLESPWDWGFRKSQKHYWLRPWLSRFVFSLKTTLRRRKLEEGKHFKVILDYAKVIFFDRD